MSAAMSRSKVLQKIVTYWTVLSMAIPPFWIALFAVWFLSVKLKLLHISGFRNIHSLIIIAVSFPLGLGFGLVVGYYGCIIDDFFYHLSNIILSFPIIILALLIAALTDSSRGYLLFLIITGMIITVSKIVRSEVLIIKHAAYIRNLRILGASDFRIIIVGESGSGKSLTAAAILSVCADNLCVTGEIFFKGRNLLSLCEKELNTIRGSGIGIVMQNCAGSLNPLLKNGTSLKHLINKTQQYKGTWKERAVALLRQVHLPNPLFLLRLYPYQLSGGMQQRLLTASGSGKTTIASAILALVPISSGSIIFL